MDDSRTPTAWFYRSAKTGGEEGPFDLVEMAGFLATGDISGEVSTRRSDDEHWLPFKDRREFQLAKDMPPGVIMRHLDQKQEQQSSGSILLKIYYFFRYFVAGLILYILSLFFFVNRHRHDSNEWLLTALRLLIHGQSNK